MYIPDLFGAFMKGRQQAINDNWQDLKNYEDIERARNVNDQGYMDLWLNRQKLPMEVSVYADKARQSSRDNALAESAFDGLYANSLMGSDYAMLNYNAYSRNRDQISELIRNTLENNLVQRGLANTAKAASNDYFSGLGADGKSRAYNMGTWRAESSYNNADGANVLAGAAPDRARAINAESANTAKINDVMGQVALGEANHTKSLQPYSQAVSNQNMIHSMQDTLNYRKNQQTVAEEQAKMTKIAELNHMAELMNAQVPGSGDRWLLGQVATLYGVQQPTPLLPNRDTGIDTLKQVVPFLGGVIYGK